MQEVLENIFPLQRPLIHCITNGITKELVANALLYVGAKPIMAEDEREKKLASSKRQNLRIPIKSQLS